MPHPFSSQPGARHWSQKGCLAQDAIESFSVGTAFRTSWLMYRRSSHSRCLANTSHVIHLCSPPHGGLHHPLYHCEPCHLAIHTQPECRCHMAAPVTWWQRLPWVLSDEVEFGGHFLNWCQQGPLALVLRAWGNFCPQRASSCSLFFCCSFWHSRLPFALDPGGRWASRALGADIGGLVSVLWPPWPGWLLSLSCPPWVIWIFSSASLRGEPPRASALITWCFLLDWRPVKLSALEPGYLGRTLQWSTSAALSHHTQVIICMVETSRSLLSISPPFQYLFCPPPLEEFLNQLVMPGCCLWGSVGHLLSLRALHKYPLSR